MPNQYNHSRRWKEEIADTASRLVLCVLLPEKLAANQRVKFVCTHGNVTETVVHRLVGRQFCCKSASSSSHPKEWYAERTRSMHKTGGHKYGRTKDHKDKISSSLISTFQAIKSRGETQPGWGWKLKDSDRNLPGILYLIRYLDESGTHFKLGITKRSLNERFKPHQLISIIHLHHATLGECFDLEQEILKWAKNSGYRYSSSTTTELIHPAAIPLLLKNDGFFTHTTAKGMVRCPG